MGRKIIDSHGHLGDILYGKNITFKQNVRKRDHHNYLEQLEANNMLMPEEFENLDPLVFSESALNEEQARNHTATLQNLQTSMDENQITGIWILPVLPHVGFEEVLAASKLDPRITPFTCIDFDLGKAASKKIVQDAEKGAAGLKIHPILQRKKLLSSEVAEALKAWEETGKPVICHTYSFCYFHPEESYRNAPENGSNPDFLELVSRFPNINFVGAHCGGTFDYDQLWEGADMKNLYVDTSFQPSSVVKEFLKRFGERRVLFGTDWPWGQEAAPIRIVEEACGGDKELEARVFYKNAEELLKNRT
ncbi:MAG: amidohydrolase family protein [Clostridiales Family XIII bacterium]|nr:amidohydrolase family protein [Clostridia bacterium]MDE8733213.1 amidohydrolase family protein [Eubacteriales bacterium DFI.9.88]MDY3009843.1 amidohydrolase family protein [Clostridiales Family XIII bacterium]